MRFASALSTEFLKLRRTKVTWATFIAYAFLVSVLGLFSWLMAHPDVAAGLGLLAQKAKVAMDGQSLDWPAFATILAELGGLGGLIMASIIVIFVYGREYAEGTAKNMLALPEPRGCFIIAKALVCSVWFLALTLWILPIAYATGFLAGIGLPSGALLLGAAGKLVALAAMDLCCAMLAAWVAVETRGYFAPFGFTIATLGLASMFGHTGWAPWVPWSIVGIYSGAAGPDAVLPTGSYVVVAATAVLGLTLTLRHEVRADNVQ